MVARLADGDARLKSRIVAGEVLTPLDLERRYGLTGGHIFHGEHALDQLYAMRPVLGWAQHRTPIRGLYLCGAGTHPGGGVTGAPGAHAARVIGKDLRRASHLIAYRLDSLKPGPQASAQALRASRVARIPREVADPAAPTPPGRVVGDDVEAVALAAVTRAGSSNRSTAERAASHRLATGCLAGAPQWPSPRAA